MGVIIGKVFAKEKEPDTPEFIAPTPNQIAIIKETWEIPKAHLTDTGEHILFRFLDDFPKNQKKFDAFSNVPLLSLKVTRPNCYAIANLFTYLLREHRDFAPTPTECKKSFREQSIAWTLRMWQGTCARRFFRWGSATQGETLLKYPSSSYGESSWMSSLRPATWTRSRGRHGQCSSTVPSTSYLMISTSTMLKWRSRSISTKADIKAVN